MVCGDTMEFFILVTVLWVFSVCLHEFGHALAALHGGDYTVRDKGYLTMNPLRYTHPVYSIILPVAFMILGGIGLPGGAVYIERHLLRSRKWETLVSLAGPAMNLGLILLISLAFKFGLLRNDPQNPASVAFGFLLLLQVSAVLLNLLPVPPLDGFQAIAPWLPLDVREKLWGMTNLASSLLFMALCFVEPVNRLFWLTVFQASSALGVDVDVAYAGLTRFQFLNH
jgi:Zn-dependent protease